MQPLGRLLDHAGRAGLPLGLGVMLGYLLADQRVRLLPTTVGAVLLVFGASLVAIVLGRVLAGKADKLTPEGVTMRRRVIAALVLVIAVAGSRLVLFWAEQPSPLTDLSPTELEAALTADSRRYRELDANLERFVRRIEEESIVPSGEDVVLSAEQEVLLVDLWVSIYETAFALDQIRAFYEDYFRFDPSVAQRSLHVRSFLLTFAAELSLYEKATRLTDALTTNSNVVKFVDTPRPSRGLPANTLGFFRQELVGARDQTRVAAGRRYLTVLESALDRRDEAEQSGFGWVWRSVERHLEVIDAVAPIARTAESIKSDLQPVKRALRRAWYPTVSSVAQWMGDTRVRRIGWYLIDAAALETMDPSLEPGDIMLSRKNWYVSNIGLPGFWPHALIYLGAPKKFEAYFDDAEVRVWVRATSGRDQSLGDYLADRWPRRYLDYRLGHEGEPYRVIEAISEGVVFNTLGHAAGDYLAALRPRVSKVDKAKAIVAAFEHLAKPYDYDFDFATDHALVCTELVWRSYRPTDGKAGVPLSLVQVAGRMTLPANEIVRQMVAAKDAGAPVLDFVYFIDANERSRTVSVGSEQDFLQSFRRNKWGELD